MGRRKGMGLMKPQRLVYSHGQGECSTVLAYDDEWNTAESEMPSHMREDLVLGASPSPLSGAWQAPEIQLDFGMDYDHLRALSLVAIGAGAGFASGLAGGPGAAITASGAAIVGGGAAAAGSCTGRGCHFSGY